MNGINRGKITEASERLCETFEELHLNMDERAIVAYSAYAAAKRFDVFEELEKEAGKKKEGLCCLLPLIACSEKGKTRVTGSR